MFACKHLTVIREIFRLASENDSVSLERKKGEKVAKKARIKALDGIKALAIFGVVVYHMGLRFLPSGHMGVVLFLVLTGFLVTSKFVREHVDTDRMLGFMMAPWATRCTTDEKNEKNMRGIDIFAEALKIG